MKDVSFNHALIWVALFLALVFFVSGITAQNALSSENGSLTPADNSSLYSLSPGDGVSPTGSHEAFSSSQDNSTSIDAEINSSLLQGQWTRIIDLPRKINDMAVDPVDHRIIYAGAGWQGSGSGVYKSEDAGLTWQLASSGLPSEDVKAIAVNPKSPNTIYASGFFRGDIYVSNDAGGSWTALGNTGIFGGLYTKLFVDPVGGNDLYSIISPGGLIHSSNGGRGWQKLSKGLPQDEDERLGAYVLSLAIDPIDAKVIYAGTGGFVGQGHGVYKSIDGGNTWSPSNRGMIDYRISVLSIDPVDHQKIYAGTDHGELFKSTDSGQSWKDISDRSAIEENEVRAIEIDPAKPDTIYILVDNIGVLISNNGGEDWNVLGRPGELVGPNFSAAEFVLSPKPMLIICVDPIIDNGGAWRYTL